MLVMPRLMTVLCDTDEARDLHYRLRYRVFCEQTGFERADAYPDGRERDEYDQSAVHFIVGDRLSGAWVGAMRLVDGRRSRLPLEGICSFPSEVLAEQRGRAVELSRLAVPKQAHEGDVSALVPSPAPVAIYTAEEGRAIVRAGKSEVLLRMIWTTFRWAQEHDFEFVFGIVTAALARILRTMDIPATPVGTEVRHRGLRRPYRYDVPQPGQEIPATVAEAWQLISNEAPYVAYSELYGSRRKVA